MSRGHGLGGRAAALALTALAALVGCQGDPFAGEISCPAALIEGVLVAQGNELTLGGERVGWPEGVRVARVNGTLALTGFLGQVIAREGDHISMGGGYQGDMFQGCGEIRVT